MKLRAISLTEQARKVHAAILDGPNVTLCNRVMGNEAVFVGWWDSMAEGDRCRQCSSVDITDLGYVGLG